MSEETSRLRVTVIAGPGHPPEPLVSELLDAGADVSLIEGWPRPSIRVFGSKAPGASLWTPWWSLPYQLFRWALEALWIRVPVVKRSTFNRWIQFALFDVLTSLGLRRSDITVGWSQVSLLSLRRTRRRGGVALLESPTAHVREWLSVVRREERYADAAMFSQLSPALIRRIEQEYAIAERINVLSQYAKRTFVAAGVPAEKIKVVTPFVDTRFFTPEPDLRDRPFRALFVGRIELLKGIHYLVDAWRAAAVSDGELLLVGRLLPESAGRLHRARESRIRLLGELSRADLRRIYQGADLFVFPSLCDGFGVVVLEALACGVPVVATRSCGAPDVVEDGRSGFLVEARDSDALAEKLNWAAHNRSRLLEMRTAAREAAVRSTAVFKQQTRESYLMYP